MLDWFNQIAGIFPWLVLLSVIMFVGSLALIPLMVARIPVDYFSADRPMGNRSGGRHPLIRAVVTVAKNLLGLVFLVAGMVMLFTPGQGFLTILIGIMLMDFPGKFALERKIVGSASVLRSINWMRARSKRPPLRI